MKNAFLCLVIATSCSYAAPNCTSSNTNTLSNKTLGAGTGTTGENGCLTVGGTGSTVNNITQDNVPTDGLYVNPSTSSPTSPSKFQTGGLEIAWTVTGSTGDWNYTYTISNSSTTGETLSHVDLGLGSSCTTATTATTRVVNVGTTQNPDNITNCIWNLDETISNSNFITCSTSTSVTNKECGTAFTSRENSVIQTPTQAESSPLPPGTPSGILAANPMQPWNTEQLVVSTDSLYSVTVSFTSEYAPTYQNVYIRDTSNYEAWNNATLNTSYSGPNSVYSPTNKFTTSGTGFFIAAPGNLMQLTPEPGYYAALAFGLGILFLAVRIRRKFSAVK